MVKPGLIDIIFPSRCAVCDATGVNLCEGCSGLLEPRPHRFQRGPISGIAATTYSNEISKLLVAFKDKGQFALVRELTDLMSPLIREIEQSFYPVYLVPVPSRSQNYSRRGFTPSLLLAKALANKASQATVMHCLALSPEVKDQVGLSANERIGNLAGSMSLNQIVEGKICYVVDDVVTTGASVSEAWRALSVAGAVVLGALVISESRVVQSL